MPLSNGIIYPFKNYGNEKNIKKCYVNTDCDKKLILEPEAPVYILESFNDTNNFNGDIATKKGFFKKNKYKIYLIILQKRISLWSKTLKLDLGKLIL